MCDGIDYVTQDLVIGLLAQEESHMIEFRGFLKEYKSNFLFDNTYLALALIHSC